MTKTSHELILCIVNTGFSETVMDAAKEVGARGGTVIHARGTANKEIVMILVAAEIKDAVLHAIYQSAGLKSEGQGIAFSMPVNHVVGLSAAQPVPQQTEISVTDEPQEPPVTEA